MIGKVFKNLMSKSANKRSAGFTLTEVVVASSLLVVALVPILKGLTSVHLTASLIEQRTKSLNYAQTVLDDIRARTIYDYSTKHQEKNQDLGNSYLCTTWDTPQGSNLREVWVVTGYDRNNDGTMQAEETLITLITLIARRW